MYKNILVPVALGGEQNTGEALDIARHLRAEGGQITLLTVIEPIPGYISHDLPVGHEKKNIKIAQANLKTLAEGVKDVNTYVIKGHPGTAITGYATENGIDFIVIASHRPGLQDYFLGSTAARVVRHATCAVHVVR